MSGKAIGKREKSYKGSYYLSEIENLGTAYFYEKLQALERL